MGIKKRDFIGKDIISIDNLSVEEIDSVLDLARDIELNSNVFSQVLNGMMMAPLFFENSTRTSSSFQAAMLQLGGNVLDFDADRSSLKKGETLRDTLKIIQGYFPDIVIIRHKKDGSARFAADILKPSVINAGDGQNQHPTQTLLDLYTIKQIRKQIKGVKIILAGDLKYGRTVHSLALALSKYPDCHIYLVSPDSLKMPQAFLDILKQKNCSFSEHNLEEFENIIPEAEIIYMTRVQRERFPEGPEGEQAYNEVVKRYCLKLEMLKKAKSGLKIMHPLPKVNEIEDEIEDTEFAYYFKQAENGLYIRKALLMLLIGGKNGN